ncbi:hypothetical protein HELRODRAFT_163541 [Helobdella robusta]|uniref:Uncharacterized protein n=1 Tax=Helobdella robusta TaxID=6412 RepID=T1EU64_HELRO|nr:hypothetical protein HELRODRAFT_163541 [Helobdella robusta]ESN96474.1 hypothetical protein HELRODRAFT_163541 [Helobdella robusta]
MNNLNGGRGCRRRLFFDDDVGGERKNPRPVIPDPNNHVNRNIFWSHSSNHHDINNNLPLNKLQQNIDMFTSTPKSDQSTRRFGFVDEYYKSFDPLVNKRVVEKDLFSETIIRGSLKCYFLTKNSYMVKIGNKNKHQNNR